MLTVSAHMQDDGAEVEEIEMEDQSRTPMEEVVPGAPLVLLPWQRELALNQVSAATLELVRVERGRRRSCSGHTLSTHPLLPGSP